MVHDHYCLSMIIIAGPLVHPHLTSKMASIDISIYLSTIPPHHQVLYGTTEMGATPALSWIAVLGYSIGSAMPAILIGVLVGPKIRAMTERKKGGSGGKAFSTTDFGRQRYGRIMQVTIACVSGFYMFIFIVAELTAISNIFKVVTNVYSKAFGIIVAVSVGFCTLFYTAIAGLPASIVTDKFQGIIMAVLVVLLTLTVSLRKDNRVTPAEFNLASNWTGEGAMAAATLILAIASAELFNQGTWQRVWAARDERAMRHGFALGSIMVFFLMMFFGILAMLAYANDPIAYDNGTKLSFLSFFDLLEPLHPGWHVVTLILVTALAASSIDSLQNGMACIFSRDLVKIGWNPKWIARTLVVLLNIPAIYLAGEGRSVLELFLVADLVCSTSVFPVFCGLQTKDYGILKAPTELGAFLGVLSGIGAVLVNGIINNAEGNVFQYFWLRNGAICALCGHKTLISFIVTPLVSLVVTYIASYLDVALRGERARAPIFATAFDNDDIDDDELDAVEASKEDDKMEPNKESKMKKTEHVYVAEEVSGRGNEDEAYA
jgi:solute:Na+ symporter, SSS family